MLRRDLGPIQIQLISLGGIIGSAYFLGAGSVLADNGPSAILAFIIGGIIAWLVSMAMGELCVGMAREGSFVSQSRELLGRPWAAGVGWSYWFNWCAYIPSEMIAGGMILHGFYPQISVIAWASLFALVITVINLLNIKHFGSIESFLSFLKLGAMVFFTLIALSIWFGFTGNTELLSAHKPDFSDWKTLFPNGALGIMATMVLVLVNFQGTEIIALSSAETKDPEKNIPRAARNVALRTLILYVLPLTMLVLIFPWHQAKVEHSIFASTLFQHGFGKLSLLFEGIIITAALSCANSGLYGAVRSLYGLGKENLAPKWVTHINSSGVPSYATWLTIAVSWAFLPLYLFFEGSHFYTWLLSVSGFTGAICWISITLCQIKMRRIAQQNPTKSKLAYQMPGFPYLSFLSLYMQIGCLGFLAVHPTLRSSLILGIPAFLIPAGLIWMRDMKKNNKLPLTTCTSSS